MIRNKVSFIVRLTVIAIFVLPAITNAVEIVTNGDVPTNTVDSARRMIDDLIATHGDKYADGKEFLSELDNLEAKLKAKPRDADAKKELDALIKKAALANPPAPGTYTASRYRSGAPGCSFRRSYASSA